MIRSIALVLLTFTPASLCIRCHQCISRNGDNRNCDVPSSYGIQECEFSSFPPNRQIRQQASGFCIAMRATPNVNRGEQVIVRTCSNQRPPDCGLVEFHGEQFTGCPLVCSYDGCNSADPPPLPLQSSYGLQSTGFMLKARTASTADAYDAPDTRTGARSIVSFGKLLISLIMMRSGSNKQN